MKNLLKLSVFAVSALFLFTACEDDHDHDHMDAAGFDVLLNNEVVLSQRGTTVTGTLSIRAGETSPSMTVEFVDADGSEIHIHDDDYSLGVVTSDETVASVAVTGMDFTVQGQTPGTVNLTIGLMHAGHYDYESRPVPVTILEAGAASLSN